MIYLDTPGLIDADHPTAPKCFLGRNASHLVADTDEELLAYVKKIGMRASWIQYPGTWKAHFDLTGRHLERALKDAANDVIRLVTSRELAHIMNVKLEQVKRERQNQTSS